MKRKLLFLAFILISAFANAQYPLLQYLGSDSTIVKSRGGLQGRFAPIPFTDTTSANLSRISQYPGALIYTSGVDKYWYRNATVTGWIEFTSSGGSTVNIYNSNGVLTGDRNLDGTGFSLGFHTLSKFWTQSDTVDIELLSTGAKVFNIHNLTETQDTTTYKPMVVDPVTGRVLQSSYWYGSGGSGGIESLGNTGILWLTRVNDSTYAADSAAISSYLLRRKDSLTASNPLGYVTKTILADSLAAQLGGGSIGIRFDSSYTPMGGARGADSFVVKSVRIRRNNITVSPTQTGDSAMYWNIDVPTVDSAKVIGDELMIYLTGASDINAHLPTHTLDIDSTYEPLAGQVNDSTWRLKSMRLQVEGSTITPTVDGNKINWNITGVSGGSTGIRFDSSYTPMGGSRGADSFVVKSIRIRRNNITITPTQTGDSAMYWNIDVPNIADSTVALRARYDSAHYDIELLNDSTVVFISFNGQRDTLQFHAGASPGTDTTSLSDRINLKLNISDTASMLSPYTRVQRFLDSLSAHTTRFNGVTSSLATKVNISDTATMLNTYVQGVGTANYYPRFNSSRKIVIGVIYQFPSSGNIGINTIVDSAYKLNVNGSTWINGITDITPGTNGYLKVSNSGATAGVVITNPSIPYMLFDIGGSSSRSFGMFNSSGDMAIQQSQTWSGVNYHVFYGNGSYSNLGSAAIGSHTLDSSAALVLQSTTKGFLAPRLTTTQRNAITSPSFGLMIYNTTDSAYQYYRASGWTGMGSVGGSGVTSVATGYGLSGGPITTTGTILVDSSALSVTYLRRKDSLSASNPLGYVTETILKDSLNDIRALLAVDTTTVPLITFTAGAGFAADTAMVTDSSLFGSLYTGQYEITITKIQAVIKGSSGDSIVLMIVYNDSFNVLGTKVTNAGLSVSSRVFGNTFDVYTNRTVPANQWIWMKPEAVISGKKPKYISVTLLGYKTYVAP